MQLPIQLSDRLIDLANFKKTDVCLFDIARSLSRQCRYNGHGRKFYSVAEHCTMLAYHGKVVEKDPQLAKCLLLHDAAEAYIGDIVYHLKLQIPEFTKWEAEIEKVIFAKFDLLPSVYPWHLEKVKRLDRQICFDEMYQLFGSVDPQLLKEGIQPINAEIVGWEPERAMSEFLDMAMSLGIKI